MWGSFKGKGNLLFSDDEYFVFQVSVLFVDMAWLREFQAITKSPVKE